MKVAHVTTDTSYGGVQEAVLGICRFTQAAGLDCEHHVVRAVPGRREETFRSHAAVHDAGEDFERAAAVVQALGPDVVHLHMPGGTFPSFVREIAATGVPMVESIHCVNRATPQEEDVMAARIVASRYVYGLQGSKERLRILPYAIDAEAWAAETSDEMRSRRRDERARLGVPHDALVIGRLGNVTPWKKVADFVHSVPPILAAANGSGSRLGFFVAGAAHEAPSYAASLVALADRLGIRNRIAFFWDIELKFAFLSMLDLFLYPTSREGYCIAAVEAMAMGIPVVTYRDSAMPDTVSDEAGTLVEPGDIEALARAAAILVCDPEARRRKSAAAARIARERNLPEAVVPQYLDVYREVAR